jgi:hypothetical protein
MQIIIIIIIILMMVKYVHIKNNNNNRVGKKGFPHVIPPKQYLFDTCSVPLRFSSPPSIINASKIKCAMELDVVPSRTICKKNK